MSTLPGSTGANGQEQRQKAARAKVQARKAYIAYRQAKVALLLARAEWLRHRWSLE